MRTFGWPAAGAAWATVRSPRATRQNGPGWQDASNAVSYTHLEQAPDLEDTLSLLNGLFTDELMSGLTYEVDVEGRPVDEVAHEFLVGQGLLEK